MHIYIWKERVKKTANIFNARMKRYDQKYIYLIWNSAIIQRTYLFNSQKSKYRKHKCI